MFTMAVSRVWTCHDCPSVFAVDSSRAARRKSRGHIGVGARLSPFRTIARRSRRRRRRDDHVARRSFTAGAARAGGRVRHSADRRRWWWCMRSPTISRRSRWRSSRCRRCCRKPISSTWWPRRSRRRRRPLPAAPCCRARWPRRSPKSAPRRHVSRSWKIPTPISRNSRSIASSSGSAIWRRSARPCSRAAICRWRPARRCSASCRRRLPASWPDGNGWAPNTPNTRHARPARRRPSRLPPTRLTRKWAAWWRICARAGNSPPA